MGVPVVNQGVGQDDPEVPEDFRYEVKLTTGATPLVVTAAREQDIDGWTYFLPASGPWTLKVNSSLIMHIQRGRPTTACTNGA